MRLSRNINLKTASICFHVIRDNGSFIGFNDTTLLMLFNYCKLYFILSGMILSFNLLQNKKKTIIFNYEDVSIGFNYRRRLYLERFT